MGRRSSKQRKHTPTIGGMIKMLDNPDPDRRSFHSAPTDHVSRNVNEALREERALRRGHSIPRMNYGMRSGSTSHPSELPIDTTPGANRGGPRRFTSRTERISAKAAATAAAKKKSGGSRKNKSKKAKGGKK